MLYELVTKYSMRVFQPVAPGRRLMHPLSRLPSGMVVVIHGVTIMSYDHHDKLAFVTESATSFLLLEELGPEFRQDAIAWSYARNETDIESQTRLIEEHLAPRVRECLSPHL